MMGRVSVVMVGGTGAVGGQVVRALTAGAGLERLTLLGRRAVEGVEGPAVRQATVDVLNPASYRHLLGGHEQAVCTVGVGQPSKVERGEFLAVDRDAAVAFATACKDAGVRHFELLGSVGADPRSASFYLRSKGELREALVALGFERLSIFQPSVILTPTNRYDVWQGLRPGVSALLLGTLRKYRGIPVETLGLAMANNLLTEGRGLEILEWDQFHPLAERRAPSAERRVILPSAP